MRLSEENNGPTIWNFTSERYEMKKIVLLFATVASLSMLSAAGIRQDRDKLDKVQQALKDDVPRILCLDERIATGGQPTDAAFAKLAANGYRAVLNLRTASEGIDLKHEQEAIEKAGMRYVNIPVVSSAPKPEQVDEFIKVVKDKDNQPMLIHCGSANRVGALWMIYRVIEQGWPEDKALDEATKIGLTSPVLKTFAHEYIVSHQPKKASAG
jgi:uncharacterized protein (TIGR01244 family)